jgi:hypothetical protein
MMATKTYGIAVAPLVALLAASLAAGCRSRAPAASPSPPPAAPAAASPPARAGARSVVIVADGQQLWRITEQGDAVTVTGKDDQPLLSGVVGANGKRTYRRPGGPPVVEVKAKDEPAAGDDDGGGGFKLRTPDGKLLWKVKVGAEKIKISSDEEGAHSFVLSLKHAEKIKVHDGDGRELGVVTFRGPEWGVVVSDASRRTVAGAHTDLRSALFGVLLIDDIGELEKPILMAELLARGL